METSATSDEALLARYLQGDVGAFESLYARHELPLWRFVLRLAGDRAAAEDLVQDVWFKVTREVASFRPGATFPPWLYTIARNRVIDWRRTRRMHESLDVAANDDDAPLAERIAADAAHEPLPAVQRTETAAAIVAAVMRLPLEQREAFVLQAEAGMSVEEIATVTGTTFETAKSRLRYARDKLKVALQEYS